MADRRTLHMSKLIDFKIWLIEDGWTIEKPKGIYEVLRARKPGRKHLLMIYKKDSAKEHLSYLDRDEGVIRAFLKETRGK